MDIVALLQCLRSHVTMTTHRRLSRIILALLVMTGRITMLSIARWAGKGGSYRTVQRLFSTVLPWAMLFWVFFRQHLYCPADKPRQSDRYASAEFHRLMLEHS